MQRLYNFALALWLISDAFRVGRASLHATGPARGLHGAMVLILTVNAWFVLRRPAPLAGGVTWWQAGWVLVAAAWPLLFIVAKGPSGPAPLPALLLQLAATLMFGASVYELGTSFAIFPERRALVSRGIYGWLRHPMYASYLLLDLGFWLANPQPWFAVVWVLEVLLLDARTRWEEEILLGDAAYAGYRRQVPWRLIPGVL